jgi:hypothetical protein
VRRATVAVWKLEGEVDAQVLVRRGSLIAGGDAMALLRRS